MLSSATHFRLLTLVETGIVKFILNENLTSAGICPQNLGGTERQLRNSDLSMTYWIMLAGFCTSVVIFFTEVTAPAIFHLRRLAQLANPISPICCFFAQIIFKFLNARFLNGNRRMTVTMPRNAKKPKRQAAPSISPPPAYATLFNRNKVWTTAEYMNTINATAIDLRDGGRQEMINGRSYMVFRNNETGEPKLVPLRTPSAALFQYSYTK